MVEVLMHAASYLGTFYQDSNSAFLRHMETDCFYVQMKQKCYKNVLASHSRQLTRWGEKNVGEIKQIRKWSFVYLYVLVHGIL